MRSLLLVFMTLLAIPSAVASDPVLVISGSNYYVIVDQGGIPTTVRVNHVIRWGDSTPLPPTDPDDPETPEDTAPKPEGTPDNQELAELVQKWAATVAEPLEAQKVGFVLATLYDGLKTDKIKPDRAIPILSTVLSQVVGSSWDSFRESLTEQTTAIAQEGRLGTKVQVLNYLASVRYGVEMSAAGTPSISPEVTIDVISKTNTAINEDLSR